MSSVSVEQNKLKEVVKNILIADKQTRNDNDRLVLAVYIQLCFYKGIILNDRTYSSVMINRKTWGLPSYESVTRCRRKLQEEDKTLRSDDNIQAMRELREEEYREWAVNN